MDIKAYLYRINYSGSLTATAATLRELQLAHLLTVPFENLSIHAGQPIILEDGALFKKIVKQRRGGFCYELNGLFAALLRGLDFNVEMLSAQVAKEEGGFGPDFDHMTLMITLEQRWLADVGFGDTFREPLLLDERNIQLQSERAYQIIEDDDHLILMERRSGKEWKPQYRFDLKPHTYADYLGMCHYHQTSPQSHFTQRRICSRAMPDGRVTLEENRLIMTVNDNKRQEQAVASKEEYETLLQKYFGIDKNLLHIRELEK
jgi:N-hydroxyarylamine O-acetyltransferase